MDKVARTHNKGLKEKVSDLFNPTNRQFFKIQNIGD